MLWTNINCLYALLILSAAATVCAMYAYYADTRRAENDPQKKNYNLFAVLMTPVTLPVFVVLYAFISILRAVAYGGFMILFLLALILIRKPFILEWLRKIALTIGNLLLEANTFLIRIFLQPLTGSRGSA